MPRWRWRRCRARDGGDWLELEVEGSPELREKGQRERARALRVGTTFIREREELLGCSNRGKIFLISSGVLSISCRVRSLYSMRKHKNINDGHVSTRRPIQPSISPHQQFETPAQLCTYRTQNGRARFPMGAVCVLKSVWSDVWQLLCIH